MSHHLLASVKTKGPEVHFNYALVVVFVMSKRISETALSLKQFLVRREVLKLYRDILRTSRQVHDEKSRAEIVEWARTDFKNNKHHSDEYVIKTLLHHGRRQLEQLELNISLTR